MALTEDRNTPMMDGELVFVPMAGGNRIFAGSIVCIGSDGFAVPGATATDLIYFGRAEEQVDNTSGADGSAAVGVRRGKAFLYDNSSGSDEITQSEVGKVCYIVDDHTVAKTDGTGTRSTCGVVLGVEDGGVWVE